MKCIICSLEILPFEKYEVISEKYQHELCYRKMLHEFHLKMINDEIEKNNEKRKKYFFSY